MSDTSKTIWYLRSGRKVRGFGRVIGHDLTGGTQVAPIHATRLPIWLTPEEISAGQEKAPPVRRERKAEPKQESPPRSYWWPLFKHMSEAHGLTLVDDELHQIALAVDKVRNRNSPLI